MPENTPIRPAVVALMPDLDRATNPDQWIHRDGRDLTTGELELIQSATLAELQAGIASLARTANRERGTADALERTEFPDADQAHAGGRS
jgi:hypothetical protein